MNVASADTIKRKLEILADAAKYDALVQVVARKERATKWDG